MRVYALYIVVAGLAVYAWKDWFKALCGLILLMAVIEHGDMPKSIMGIQGLNPWNVLFASILISWLASRRQWGLKWDMPTGITVLLLLYLTFIVLGFVRALLDRTYIENYPTKALISEELINTIKWVLPGVLLFDGCRTRKQAKWALACILAMYFLLGLQVIRRVPLSSVSGGGVGVDAMRARQCQRIGYNRCDMSPMLAGATWGIMACVILVRRGVHKVLVALAAAATAFGQLLTGGRSGLLATGAIALAMCTLRWRKGLLLLPLVPLLIAIAFPAVVDRALTGLDHVDAAGQSVADKLEVGAGRFQAWPHVIQKIAESPVLGHGRLAMKRTGLTGLLGATYGESEAFPHPHNVYLEWLLDNGVAGLVPVILFFVLVVAQSARLFVSRTDPLRAAIGGACLGAVLAQLIAGIGSQHFYPKEGTLGMWVAIFLLLRARAGLFDTHLVPKPARGPLGLTGAVVSAVWRPESMRCLRGPILGKGWARQ